MSGNADEFREVLASGNYDPDEGITDDSSNDSDDSSSDSGSGGDFGEELGAGQRTSGGERGQQSNRLRRLWGRLIGQ